MTSTVLTADLDSIDPADITTVGGKATTLAALRRIDGLDVPDGFCVTDAAFALALSELPDAGELRRRLWQTTARETAALQSIARDVRRIIARNELPDAVAEAITTSLGRFRPNTAFAVRSSATAEDLPGASFAGQHDTFLHVVGREAVQDAVRKCWASLFHERAIIYRKNAGFTEPDVRMAVVVQQMVPAEASGVLFTADPLSGDRRTAVVEAVRGVGEEFLGGRAGADLYTIHDGHDISHRRSTGGGAVLTAAQLRRLVHTGRQIADAVGAPQDIEWCFARGECSIVQSRPITTLFPIPAPGDDDYHVYLSVGHQQMMTDAIRPLGISCWQMTTRGHTMVEAGARLFVDATRQLVAPASRRALLRMIREHDPLTYDALQSVLDGQRLVIETEPERTSDAPGSSSDDVADESQDPPAPDASLVAGLISRSERSVAEAEQRLAAASGPELFEALRQDWEELRRVLFDPESHAVFTAAMEAASWLNEKLDLWLGEVNAADVLTRSVPHDVTFEMGLALLEVADVIRPHRDVVRHLRDTASNDAFMAGLDDLPGGPSARQAIEAWLARYGARCPGEIDITRPRWAERPSMLLPLLLGHVDHAEPGEAQRRRDHGRREAEAWESELIRRLREEPDGEAKAAATRRRIAIVRTYMGYREYPKYGLVRRYWIYKQAILREVDRLVAASILRTRDDAYFLGFDELHEVAASRRADLGLIDRRRAEYQAFTSLVPPRVLTSDGESFVGAHADDVERPSGSLVGVPVSSGVVEGRARVLLRLDSVELAPGDVLVTRYTDPSWTPLFLTAAALVTEVGGLMTHGAVVAREYGLPAVVSVLDATALIRDGQPIRVDGARGWVELLEE